MKDNKLTISYDDGYSDVLTINELTANKLVLKMDYYDEYQNSDYEVFDAVPNNVPYGIDNRFHRYSNQT